MLPVTADLSRKLTDLEVGATARMLDAAVDAELRTLLRSLGLTDNSPLRVCKRGEPCVVRSALHESASRAASPSTSPSSLTPLITLRPPLRGERELAMSGT